MTTKNVRIKKTGADDYIYGIREDRVAEEVVNGAQLMGVLNGRLSGNTDVESLMSKLDNLQVGDEISVQIETVL